MPETTVRFRPKSLYAFSRNRCTAYSETTVRFRPSRTLLADLGKTVATEGLKRAWRRVTAKDTDEAIIDQAVGGVVEEYAQQFADLKPVFAAWRQTAAYDEIYARFQAGVSEDELIEAALPSFNREGVFPGSLEQARAILTSFMWQLRSYMLRSPHGLSLLDQVIEAWFEELRAGQQEHADKLEELLAQQEQLKQLLHEVLDVITAQPASRTVPVPLPVARTWTDRPAPAPGDRSAIIVEALSAQNERLVAHGDMWIQQQLEKARTAVREGRADEARTWLRQRQEDTDLWRLLPNATRAALLRFEGGLVLDEAAGVERAVRLTEQARELAPDAPPIVLEALIAARRSGPAAAAELLRHAENTNARNLRAALLLEVGELDEAKGMLRDMDSPENENLGETLRLLTLAAVLAGNLPEARTLSARAFAEAGTWVAVRQAVAIVDYYASLAPATLSRRAIAPDPVPPSLVRTDEEALLRRSKAADVFADLARIDLPRRRDHHAWLLACVIDLPERRAEAQELCAAMLAEQPADPLPLLWAIERVLPVDREPSKQALAGLVSTDPDIGQIQALVVSQLIDGQVVQALETLDAAAPVFERASAQGLWMLLHTQALVRQGDAQAAVRALEGGGTDPETLLARAIALRAAAQTDAELDRLASYLDQVWSEVRHASFLLEWIAVQGSRSAWDSLVDRSNELLHAFPTDEILQVVLGAAYNSQRPDVYLKLWGMHLALFGRSGPPRQLQRLHVVCLVDLGRLPEARSGAEALIIQQRTGPDLLLMGQVQYAIGDLDALRVTAARVGAIGDVDAVTLLQFAALMRLEDDQLAIELWRRAAQVGVPDAALGTAVDLAFQLGLEEAVVELFARLTGLAGQPQAPVRQASLQELVAFVRERREQRSGLDVAYRTGTAPIHLIAALAGYPLPLLYRGQVQANEHTPKPANKTPIFYRHGGRGSEFDIGVDPRQWRVRLDTSSVLLAKHLDLLEHAERAFAALRIPLDLIPALHDMRDKVAKSQRSRVDAWRQVTELAAAGKLTRVDPRMVEPGPLVREMGSEWVSLFHAAKEAGGYLVGFLPMQTLEREGPPAHLPEHAGEIVTNCRVLLDLLRNDTLSQSEYSAALRALGSEGGAVAGAAEPRLRTVLYLDGTIAEVLARAQLLHLICAKFQVHVPGSELDRVRLELAAEARRRELASWLRDLIMRVSRGLDSGRYEVIPPRYPIPNELRKREEPAVRAVLTLLSMEAAPSEVTWLDDRMLSAFGSANGSPIVTTFEVAKALARLGGLSGDNYRAVRARMRAGDLRFTPLDAEEIVLALGDAPATPDGIASTQELDTLRRHAAASLGQGNVLQKPTQRAGAPNPFGEMAYVAEWMRAVREALVETWRAGRVADAAARVEWIIRDLYLDPGSLLTAAGLARRDHKWQPLATMELTALVAQGMTLHERRDEWFKWLYARVLRPRFRADPALLGNVARQLKGTLLSTTDLTSPVGPTRRVRAALLLSSMFQDLPEALQEELGRDAALLRRIGIVSLEVVGGLRLRADAYWSAAARAIAGQEVRLRTVDSRESVLVRGVPEREGIPGITFERSGKPPSVVRTYDFLALLEPRQRREEALLARVDWFDADPAARKRVVRQIASVHNPQARLERLRAVRRTSVNGVASIVRDHARYLGRIDFDRLLPATADRLLTHLRMSPKRDLRRAFADAMQDAVNRALVDEPLVDVIQRFSGLPIPLPTAIEQHVRRLAPTERTALASSLMASAESPLRRLHALRIASGVSKDAPDLVEPARTYALALLEPEGEAECAAYLQVLNWLHAELDVLPGILRWPAPFRLAAVWTTADVLFATLRTAGIPASRIGELFEQAPSCTALDFFQRDPAFYMDAAHPHRVGSTALLSNGIGYALGNATQVASDERLRESFAARVFSRGPDGERVLLPATSLVTDASLAANSLGSFLGGDRAQWFGHLLTVEEAMTFAPGTYAGLLRHGMESVGVEERRYPWWLLAAIVGDLPVPSDLADLLDQRLQQVAFAGLFRADIVAGINALVFASSQCRDAGRADHLAHEAVEIARYCGHERSGQISSTERGFVIEKLLETSLNLALLQQIGAPARVHWFSDLVAQIADVWPECAVLIRPYVECLAADLPPPQARALSTVIVQLRTH